MSLCANILIKKFITHYKIKTPFESSTTGFNNAYREIYCLTVGSDYG